MRKFIITAELRAIEKQVALGEISYSRMVELLNEKADKWFEEKMNEQLNISEVKKSVTKLSCDRCDGKPETEENNLCGDCYSDLHGM